MARFGPDYMTNPLTQIEFAIWYGQERYGSLCGAAAFEFGYSKDGVWHEGRGWW